MAMDYGNEKLSFLMYHEMLLLAAMERDTEEEKKIPRKRRPESFHRNKARGA